MTTADGVDVLDGGAPIAAREAELADGAEALRRSGSSSWIDNPRLLLGASAALMTLGVSIVLLGWFGAAHSTLVEEQVPYLISGGLLGVALSTIGAFLFFAYWLTVSIREARAREATRRADHAELMVALQALSTALTQEGGSGGAARSTRAARPIRRAPRS